MINAAALNALNASNSITLRGIVAPIIADAVAEANAHVGDDHYVSGELHMDTRAKEKLAALFKTQFHKYDTDNDKKLSPLEIQALLSDVGERLTVKETQAWIKKLNIPTSREGEIFQEKFLDMMLAYASTAFPQPFRSPSTALPQLSPFLPCHVAGT